MGAQKTRPRQEVEEGPPRPTTAAIQMTPRQLFASLSKAKTEEELDHALRNTLNHINSLSPQMTKKELEQNSLLISQLETIIKSWEEKGVQPKLAIVCLEKLYEKMRESEYAPAPGEFIASRIQTPVQFQQFDFIQHADLFGRGSVSFGNLPSQIARELATDQDKATVLQSLNRLANAYFSGGNTKKAGNEFLKTLEKIFRGYGLSTEDVTTKLNQALTQDSSLYGTIIDSLKDGTYGQYFFHEHASFSEWRRSGSSNFLAFEFEGIKLVFSTDVTKEILQGRLARGGVGIRGAVYQTRRDLAHMGEGEAQYRERETRYLPGGGAFIYGEVGEETGRWKTDMKAGVEYVPLGAEGSWFLPVEVGGQVTGGTEELMTNTIRMQVKVAPELAGKALSLEGGVIWNALFYREGDTAYGFVFGVKGTRMSVDADGTTWVELMLEGQAGPTFQKILREKNSMVWAGLAAIVQQTMPEGIGAEGDLPSQTKLGAGLQAGVKGERAEASLKVVLNPITINPQGHDFTGNPIESSFQGVMGVFELNFGGGKKVAPRQEEEER